MSNGAQKSLAKELVFFVVGVSTCFAFLVTSMQIYFEYQQDYKEVEQSVDYLKRVSTKSLGNAIWYIDAVQIETILSGIRELPNVETVELNTDSMEIVKQRPASDAGIQKLFPLFYQSGKLQKKVGTLIVNVSLEKIYLNLVKKFAVGLVGNMLKTLGVSFLLLWFIRKRFTSRIELLGEYASHVALDEKSSDSELNSLKKELESKKPDEIVLLFKQIQVMEKRLMEHFQQVQVREREYSQKLQQEVKIQKEDITRHHAEMVEASRRAGMAEVAIGFLHNIGNIMTTLFVSCDNIIKAVNDDRYRERVEASIQLLVQKVPQLALFFQTPDGEKVNTFLNVMNEQKLQTRVEIQNSLSKISSGLRDIEEIVKLQMSYSKSPEVMSACSISSIIEKTVSINKLDLEQNQIDLKIEIIDDIEFDTVTIKLSQILVNILLNAIQAFHPDQEERSVILKAGCDADGVYFSCEDNGIGISNELMVKIFSFGFTTKTTGSGFGLHSSSLMASELGGVLDVSSEGPGKGSKFTVKIPIKGKAQAS